MKKREEDEDIFLKKLGSRIKEMRNKKGISQVELGYLCDIEKQNMNRIESGNTNPTILSLRKICLHLDIKLDELLNFD